MKSRHLLCVIDDGFSDGGEELEDNWVIENLEQALATWNNKLSEIWQLLSQSPEEFKGGNIWRLAVNINDALQAVGLGLLILFFAMSIFKSSLTFRDFKRPEQMLHYFIRFVAAKAAVTYGMEIMTAIFTICAGIISTAAGDLGSVNQGMLVLPEEIKTAVEEVGFLAGIPLWIVTILGSVFITVLSFVMILTVYARFFRLYMYTALAPIPLATFAGEMTASTGIAFIKSYIGVCLEGAIIVLACVIFSAFITSGDTVIVGESSSAVAIVWGYLAENIFNMLVLVGLVKGADRIVKEIFGL